MKLTLNQKLSLGVVVIVTGTLVSVMSIGNSSITRAIEGKIRNDLLKAKEVFEYFQKNRFEELLVANRIIAEVPHLKAVVTTSGIDHATILDSAQDIRKVIKSDLFMISNAQGILLASAGEPERYGDDLSKEPAFERALGGEDFLGFWTTGEGAYQVVASPFLFGDDVAGTLLVGYSIDQEMINTLAEMTNSEIAFITDNQLIASESTTEHLGRFGLEIMKLFKNDPEQIHTELMDDERHLLLSIPYGDDTHQGFYILARSLDQELLFYHQIQRRLFVLGIFILIIALIFSLFYSKRITQPINALVRETQRIARGDLTSQVVISSTDEIGDLAASFNKMTVDLKKRDEMIKAANQQLVASEQQLKAMNQQLTAHEQQLKSANQQLKANEQQLRASNQQLESAKSGLEEKVRERTKELEKASEQLKESTLQVVQSEKLSAIGEITAGVAHELNHSLNATKIICQSILRDIKKDRFEIKDAKKDLPDIVTQMDKMAAIIDHMRIFSRRTEGTVEEEIDVNAVLENTFIFLGQQLKERDVAVIKEYSPALPKPKGDMIRLEQVFMNLITNAKHSVENSGKEDRKIEIKTYKKDDPNSVVTEITDNGKGIPEDLREKIFESFFTTKEKGRGTGLGLSISKKIIEEHRGRIEVESTVGEGATFRVILPVAG